MQREAKPVRHAFVRLGAVLLPGLLACLLTFPGLAQQLPSGDQLQQLLQRQGGQSAGNNAVSPGSPPDVLMQPVMPQAWDTREAPQSRLEQIMSSRAGTRLRQFGYDRFGVGQAVLVPQTGAVQDDYIIGPGDEIVASLRGQENNDIRTVVDRNGQVVLPRLNPIPAAGRTFGDFRRDVEDSVRRAFVATSAFVSVGHVRQISVLVTGEVNNPGQRLATGLSSAVDVLLLSGGVKKSGSLRNIRIQRGGREYNVDLYSVLTGRGGSAGPRLADGDRVVVPPLGRTVAVSGLVRRPGIYELPAGQSSISIRSVLQLAGGQEVRGRYRLSALRISPEGQSSVVALSSDDGALRDSEILFVQMGADRTAGQATLAGSSGLAGSYAVSSGEKLSSVVRAPGALGASPYTLFGIVSRRNARNLMRELLAFTPVAVMDGSEDSVLQGDDIVRPISVNEAQLLTNAVCTYLANEQAAQEAMRNPTARDISDFSGSNKLANNTTNNTQTPSQPVVVDANDLTHDESYRGCLQNEGGARVFANQTATGQISATVQRPIVDQFGDPLPEYFLRHPSTAVQPAAVPAIGTEGAAQAREQTDAFDAGDGYRSETRRREPFNFPMNEARPTFPASNFEDEVQQGDVASNREVTRFSDLARQLGVSEPVLITFLIDHQVVLTGAIRGPGRYFVGPSVNLPDLVSAAGGAVNWADTSAVEVISTAVDTQTGRSLTTRASLSKPAGTYANYRVRPQDVFRFNTVYTENNNGTVTIQGEVRSAGNFQIRRGERLSELLLRAGGLTASAYPYGTVFLRKSVANMEHESYVRAAKEAEDQLLVSMTRIGTDKLSPETFTAMQGFITDLRNQKAVGRISVTADPSVLAARPNLDPLLEPGDMIYIPQRPSTISVLGQVRQPGSYLLQPQATIRDYIQRAGGYAPTADDSNAYIVLPDGSARKVETSWLNFSSNDLPPGSSIVVPRDVTPLDLRQVIIDTSQIFSQLAISIASVAVISR